MARRIESYVDKVSCVLTQRAVIWNTLVYGLAYVSLGEGRLADRRPQEAAVISSAPRQPEPSPFRHTLTHSSIHLSSSAIFTFPSLSNRICSRLNTPDISVLPNILSCSLFRHSTMKGLLLLLPLAAASPFSIGTIHKDVAPLLSSSNAKEVPNSYVIKFKKHVTHEAANKHHSWVQDLHYTTQNTKAELRKRDQFPFQDTVFEGLRHTYNIAGNFLGYSGHFDDDVIEQVRRHPDVGLRPSTLSGRSSRVHLLG
jgi:hypothetical protein